MKNLEGNKIAAAVLIAGLLALVSGKIADSLYHKSEHDGGETKRGYQVAVDESAPTDSATSTDEVIDVAALLAAADKISGEKSFKKCAACHTAEQGGAHRVGPNLHGVVDDSIASKPGYAYSDAMKAKGGKWSSEELVAFLHNPKKSVPGTKMTFAGFKNPKDAADLVAYLKSNGN